jgi:hypothetical protein
MDILGIDDREEKLAKFCLVTSTFTIEQYCKRRLLKKQHSEVFEFSRDLFFTLREYPVISIKNNHLILNNGQRIFREHFCVVPDCGSDLDIPFAIELSPILKRYRGFTAIKVVYTAGYSFGNVPQDLVAACLELASWNMSRYRGQRIGMTGNVRGSGKDGEHFELAIPQNVRALLEPYKRKVI